MEIGPATECEIKIPVEDLEAVRRRLLATGWLCTHEKQREVNILVDMEDGALREADRALRLRTYGERSILTMKGPAHYDGPVKIREELEVELSDLHTMVRILERLGLRPVVRYEKDRETWRRQNITATLDSTPMGHFVEIEGSGTELETTARDMGLDPDHGVRGSYLDLWEHYRLSHPEDGLPHDMVFAR